ncbi:hypothetical protein ACMFMG_012230 [Clarireedia jacksonii]
MCHYDIDSLLAFRVCNPPARNRNRSTYTLHSLCPLLRTIKPILIPLICPPPPAKLRGIRTRINPQLCSIPHIPFRYSFLQIMHSCLPRQSPPHDLISLPTVLQILLLLSIHIHISLPIPPPHPQIPQNPLPIQRPVMISRNHQLQPRRNPLQHLQCPAILPQPPHICQIPAMQQDIDIIWEIFKGKRVARVAELEGVGVGDDEDAGGNCGSGGG